MVMTTSSRCHLSPAPGSLRRIWLASAWPNLRAHCRTLSWLTMIPRAASISSTMRRPSGNRKYSQIAWLMISAGKRWPAYGERAGVVIPLGYPAHSATASPSARNLTVPVDPPRGDHAHRPPHPLPAARELALRWPEGVTALAEAHEPGPPAAS